MIDVRLINYTAYNNAYELFDNRSLFIVRTEDKLYVWYGKDISDLNQYNSCFELFLSYIKQYEHFNGEIIKVKSGEENDEFISLIRGKINPNQINEEYSMYFRSHNNQKINEEKEKDDDKIKTEFFTYHEYVIIYISGNWEQYKIFDCDDLITNSLCVLHNTNQSFVWIGSEFNDESVNIDDLVDKFILEKQIPNNKIILNEGEETEEFWSYLE